jgi:hypothetical protein
MKDLSEMPFVPELKMASLDISNMYTYISTGDLINVIDTLCKKHNLDDALIREILTVTKIIITQNYFSFKGKTYLQKKVLAMGAPTSSILSEIDLQHLENTKIFDILRNSRVEGYFRCVDDVLLMYNEN